jgi:transposase, IS605 OrfB family, central region
VFRTIKLKLPYDRTLIETAKQFKEAVQIVLDYGFENKTFNKNKLNKGTYKVIRERIPTLPSALIQTARDTASEALKATELKKKIKRKSLTIRYDNRTFKFYPDSHTVSLTTVKGRLVYPVAHSPLIDKYRGQYTNAQLLIDEKRNRIFIMVQVNVPDKEVVKKEDVKVLGIDRGVKNIAVLSNNLFFNSKHLREVKGRYQYLKRKLQHLGTRSAHRKLRKLSGRERRFVRDVNHLISKNIVSLPYDVFALEALNPAYMKQKDQYKAIRKMLGSWSPSELQKFIEYKAKDAGKTVIYVNPKYTSQRCSKCGYVDKNNRHGSVFKCINCGFELNADLNASRNIEVLGRSEYFRLMSTSQSLRFNESPLTGGVENSNKLRSFSEE